MEQLPAPQMTSLIMAGSLRASSKSLAAIRVEWSSYKVMHPYENHTADSTYGRTITHIINDQLQTQLLKPTYQREHTGVHIEAHKEHVSESTDQGDVVPS